VYKHDPTLFQWSFDFQYIDDDDQLYHWQWMFPFSIRHHYSLLTPFDQPTIFLSYPQWTTFLASFYDTNGIMAFSMILHDASSLVLSGVFMDYFIYSKMKAPLEKDTIRLQHRWFDARIQYDILRQSLEQWFIFFFVINGLTLVFLEWARLQAWFAQHAMLFTQWRALGVSQKHVQASIFNTLWKSFFIIGFLSLCVLWFGVSLIPLPIMTRLNGVLVVALIFLLLSLCLWITQTIFQTNYLR
jgi:hypothetical protein